MIKFKRGIRLKIILFVCSVGLILVIAGVGLGYFRGSALLRDTIVFEHKEIAKRISATVSEIIDKEVNVVETHITSPLWQCPVIERNQERSTLQKEAIQKVLIDTDKEWAQAKEDSPLIKECLNTPLSLMLKKLIEVDKDIKEIFVTDNSGGITAASKKTSDFYQADKKWWQEAFYKGSVFIGDIEFDESIKAGVISIAVPMKDNEKNIIGVCKVVISLDSFLFPLARVKIGKTGRASLVDNKGYFLFHEDIKSLSRRFSSEAEFRELIEGKDQWEIRAAHAGYKGKMLTVAAPLDNPYLLKEGKNWWILVSQDVNEAFAALNVLFEQMFIVSVILLILLVFLGHVFGGVFVRPILKLHNAVIEVSRGNLDYKIEEIKTNDEIEECANSFRNMVVNIKTRQEEILKQHTYIEAVISSMIDTLIVVDPEGVIKTVNRATLDLLGYTEDELIGQPAAAIFAEEEEEEELLFKGTGLEKLIREGSVRDFEMTYKTKTGEKIPVSFSGSVMHESSYSVQRTAYSVDAERNTHDARRIIGIIGVARDMRRIKALMADLEGTKAVVEEYARTLEKKVEERTKTLSLSQEATLNIMEDMQEEKEKVAKQAAELVKAHKELESFSKGLEEKVDERTMELSILYEVSNAISYTLDYQTLLRLIMESLFKIVDYDLCASLLFDANTANVTLKLAYTQSAQFVDEIKNSLIDSSTMLTGESIRKRRISAFLIPSNPEAKPKEERRFDKLRSFFNVPFVVRGKTIGMINVSSCKDNAFSEEDVKLIYTIANQASNAIERLQAVITAEKSKMESMVESMAEGVIMIDERGEVVVINPRARQLLDIGFDGQVTAKIWKEKAHAIGLQGALKKCEDDNCLISKDMVVSVRGEAVSLYCDIAPVKNEKGEIIGIVTILRDITKEKEVDQMKTEFVSIVSHELRTPLTIMKEFAAIISDELPGKLTKDQKEYIDIIKGNIDRLARLINNLLDISKIEAGKAELKKTLVDITKLALEVVSTLKPEAEEKHIEFKTLFPNSGINIYADSDRIVQVFTNLISNAIKFTPEKGQITVEIKDMEKEVECNVADTGAGISSENLGRLFTKFQQFGRVPGGGTKGTGLGLAITKELVQNHKGKIWAESKLGKGSKFIFVLPKYTAETLLKEYVEDWIKEAMKKDLKTSLITITISNFDKLKQKLTSEKIDAILKDMDEVLRNSLRAVKGDNFFRNTNEIAVILGGCDKEKVLRIEGRLEQTLDSFLDKQKLTNEIKLRFGSATYPDEAENAEELIEKAKGL